VFPDKSIEFTIGGGVVEAEIIKEAASLAASSGGSIIKKYYLEQLDMHCGGAMRVLYEVISQPDKMEPFYSEIVDRIDSGESFVVSQLLSGDKREAHYLFAKTLVHADGSVIKQDETLANSAEIVSQSMRLLSSGERVLRGNLSIEANGKNNYSTEFFLEVINRPLRLLIYGAGHVGTKFAELASASGLFRVEIADDRPEFADRARLPFVDQIYSVSPDYEGEIPLPDERTYVGIMTRCHDTDRIILDRIFQRDIMPPYLGMIGSGPKRANLCHKLKESGISEEKLEHIITPMGLPIGGRDPREISISMLAEIIKVKNEHEKNFEGGTKSWSEKIPLVHSKISGS
jgi:xanthine dehydrogenase accessory factor